MSLGNLGQAEADALMYMEKHYVDGKLLKYPGQGQELEIPLVSADKRESFILDVSRGNINLSKVKYQERARQVEALVRLELGGPPHRNPDDSEIGVPHIHIYKEGFGDKWAYEVPLDRFPRLSDIYGTLDDFMAYCNITQTPKFLRIQRELSL